MRYQRVLVKLSGGAVAGEHDVGFSPKAIEHIVHEILLLKDAGTEVAIVIGGGNIFRGNAAKDWGIDRAEADHIGMIGTVINSLMLRAALKARSSYEVRVMTAIPMEVITESYIRLRAIHHLEKGYFVIFAGGIGQPFVTTDYPAVQRALETKCQAIFVAKQGVDGVYTADPKKNHNAKRFETLGYDDFIREDLKIMDHSALLLARDYGLPIHIFNFKNKGAMKQICEGNNIGTTISPGLIKKTVS